MVNCWSNIANVSYPTCIWCPVSDDSDVFLQDLGIRKLGYHVALVAR